MTVFICYWKKGSYLLLFWKQTYKQTYINSTHWLLQYKYFVAIEKGRNLKNYQVLSFNYCYRSHHFDNNLKWYVGQCNENATNL